MVYRILRYLKEYLGKCLLCTRSRHLRVDAPTDAKWAGSVSNRCSTSGYCTFVGGNLVAWRGKKQTVMVESSVEAKLSMAHGICELLWLKILLAELGFPVQELMNRDVGYHKL